MRKVKCFACGKLGHYALQSPNKKGKKKGVTASAEVDEFTSRFDTKFALVLNLATHVTSFDVWFVDSGASFHMIGVRQHFMSLTKDDIDLEVELGDKSKVRAAGVGIISFQREESLPPESDKCSLCFKDEEQLDYSLQY